MGFTALTIESGDSTVVRLVVQALGIQENIHRAAAIENYREEMEAYEAVLPLSIFTFT